MDPTFLSVATYISEFPNALPDPRNIHPKAETLATLDITVKLHYSSCQTSITVLGCAAESLKASTYPVGLRESYVASADLSMHNSDQASLASLHRLGR